MIYPNLFHKFRFIYLTPSIPIQSLFSHAESIFRCRSKHLKIQVIDYQLHKIVLEMQKLCRGTLGGQKIGKNLQMKLPSKKEKANI